MAAHDLGRSDDARTYMDRLRGLMETGRFAENEETQAFYREAETRLNGDSDAD